MCGFGRIAAHPDQNHTTIEYVRTRHSGSDGVLEGGTSFSSVVPMGGSPLPMTWWLSVNGCVGSPCRSSVQKPWPRGQPALIIVGEPALMSSTRGEGCLDKIGSSIGRQSQGRCTWPCTMTTRPRHSAMVDYIDE